MNLDEMPMVVSLAGFCISYLVVGVSMGGVIGSAFPKFNVLCSRSHGS